MINILIQFLNNILENTIFLIIITFGSFLIKGIILFKLIYNIEVCRSLKKTHLLLSLTLFFSLFEDIAWIMHILNKASSLPFDWQYALFYIKIAWITSIIRDTILVLFFESLFSDYSNFHISRWNIIYILCSSLFIIGFIIAAIGQLIGFRFTWVTLLMKIATIYAHFFLFLPTNCILLCKIYRNHYPRIFKKQLKIAIYFFLLPYTFADCLWLCPQHLTSLYIFTLNIIVPALIYYCSKKLINLRFLNINNYVQTPTRFSFIKNFTEVLENMAQASTIAEINFITKSLFHKAFGLTNSAVHIYISTSSKILPSTEYDNTAAAAISSLLDAPDAQLLKAIHKTKILIYDEIDFTNYYEKSEENQNLLAFLNNINADVFIPIYNHRKIIGCITIDKEARPKSFYGHTERAEMIIFASYLGNITNLLANRNLEHVLVREQELKLELYNKLQENNQCKEILRSLLKSSSLKKIGIVFYKTRKFVFGNHQAQELININLNVHAGHPITKTCKQVVAEVESYQTTQTRLTTDDEGNVMVVSGMPYLERSHVILLIYHQETPGVIIDQLNQLKDPSAWDYLFYLQATESGRLINSLIPGKGESLLNFKIELLKTALNLKATLLDIPSEDLATTVELIHRVSLRTTLYTIELDKPQKNADLAITLFGINPLLGLNQQEEPLLKKLDGTGTLFIKNIHLLDRETQRYLADFIRYGYFTYYKGEQKIFSNVRIVCSSNHSLETMVQKGLFIDTLYQEIKKSTLIMPSLHTLTQPEIEELLQEYAQQAVANKTVEKIVEFNEKDVRHIINTSPSSFAELRKRATNLLIQKLKNNNIDSVISIDHSLLTDPELVEIAKMGKHALKNEKVMSILWNKFNNQNKIASFLGVNRSSVNRRCKAYNLE